MPIELDALAEFITALEEVEILIDSASRSTDSDKARQYAAYNKCAILLLAGKFEAFVESITDNYVETINSLSLSAAVIPHALKLEHTLGLLQAKLQKPQKLKDPIYATELFNGISELWTTSNTFNAIKVSCRFSYGKHGSDELKKLFIPIGIEDVFESIKIFALQDPEDSSSLTEIDFKGTFNSVTNIRNNILHQDATPSLTHVSIAIYREQFQNFATQLSNHLLSNLEELTV